MVVAPIIGLDIKNEKAIGSLTRGLVGDTLFAVMPQITSKATFIITLAVQLVYFPNRSNLLTIKLSMVKMVVQPTYILFLASVTACGFASFLFGYHVHEKAVLLIIIPLSYHLLMLLSLT
jgi:alpha-1,3-glucosyltransferase